MRTDSHQQVVRSDISADLYSAALDAGKIAWDIETSGLDWEKDQIGTCQIAFAGHAHVIALDRTAVPERLAALLSTSSVQKVFHHAPFDLRFMVKKWRVTPQNIACTKVASKIVDPQLQGADHSLKPALRRHLGVTVSKREQVSDWLADRLSQEQIAYATSDVAYLLDLSSVLERAAQRLKLTPLLEASWNYLPTRALLDVRGSGDVFDY